MRKEEPSLKELIDIYENTKSVANMKNICETLSNEEFLLPLDNNKVVFLMYHKLNVIFHYLRQKMKLQK